ncbi:hypothetical protein [Mesorhizobium sp. 1B3]|uniref:hypothetical protein n=1 Tax=Mesorhizobium sp. 1B3 TaxID=3243599 RepID=UPI003D9774BE
MAPRLSKVSGGQVKVDAASLPYHFPFGGFTEVAVVGRATGFPVEVMPFCGGFGDGLTVVSMIFFMSPSV